MAAATEEAEPAELVVDGVSACCVPTSPGMGVGVGGFSVMGRGSGVVPLFGLLILLPFFFLLLLGFTEKLPQVLCAKDPALVHPRFRDLVRPPRYPLGRVAVREVSLGV